MTVKVGEIETPEFQGTHLWNRLCWAKENLEMVRSEYCVVWEDPQEPDEPANHTSVVKLSYDSLLPNTEDS